MVEAGFVHVHVEKARRARQQLTLQREDRRPQLFAQSLVTQPGTRASFERAFGWTGTSWAQLGSAPTIVDFASGSGTAYACSGTAQPPMYPYAVVARLGRQVVMVGGSPMQTQSWDGAKWTQLGAGGLPPRGYAAMSSFGGTLLLFGGEVSDGVLLDDTWSWDGAKWTQVNLSGPAPSPRMSASMTELNGQLVLFGGWDPSNRTLGDTWTWDGHGWTKHDVAGPQPRAEAYLLTVP
jgi:hypothetical protein